MKVTEPKMCILIFSTIRSETFLTLRRILWQTITNAYRSSRKLSAILVRFSGNLHFINRFSTNPQISISWKLAQWEPNCSLETDGRTDRHDEANSRFSQFWEKRLKTFNTRGFKLSERRFIALWLRRSWHRADLWGITNISKKLAASTSSDT